MGEDHGMSVLFAGVMPVHYGFIYLGSDDDGGGELIEERVGQVNGLIGAQRSGRVSMITGLHTGDVSLTIEWLPNQPVVGAEWEDVVEVPFVIEQAELTLSSFETFISVEVPQTGPHRVRYRASGMDAGKELDTTEEGEQAPDRYLLQLWPASLAPEAILRETAAIATYWHGVARAEPN
jgi:hypothetical protein